MTDEKLVEKFRSGNIQAFNCLVERWQQRIHRFAFRYFSSYDEAMEITQKTFIRAYRSIDTLKDNAKFPAWIYRIANNLCLDETKRAGRRKTAPLDKADVSPENTDSGSVQPDLGIIQQEVSNLLQKALNLLPPEQRIVIILKEYEGLKFREIAEILEEPENTIKSRMYYGLTALRKIFDKWNIKQEVWNYE